MTVAFGIVLIVLGVLLSILDFLAYAKRRLNNGFGLVWLVFCVMFLAAGIVCLAVPESLPVLLLILFVVLVFFLFGVSQVVSVLVMKNRELAMQVSLLNQENESILQELGKDE